MEYASSHGLKIVRDFEEIAPASSVGRPAFAAVVTYLRKHPGTALVVEKMDRLARNSADSATVNELIDEGVEIHLVRDLRVLSQRSSPGERLSSDIEGAVAQHYSRNLGREVKKGIDARFAAGYFPMGRPPLGYMYPPRRPGERVNIVPDPTKAEIVVAMFKLYTSRQGSSFREVADLAAQLGFKNRTGKMTEQRARDMLMNPLYAGWIRHNGKLSRGLHQPLITQAMFDAAQARIASRTRPWTTKNRKRLLHAFSGVFVCSHCGSSIMRISRGKRDSRVYWTCFQRCEQAKYVPEQDLKELACEHLELLRLPRDRVQKLVGALAASVEKERRENPEAKLQAIVTRERKVREQLLDLLQEGEITREQYRDRKLMSEEKEAAASERLEHLQRSQGSAVGVGVVEKYVDHGRELVALFASATEAEQRRILGDLWETRKGAARSKLDCVKRRIEPSWRPMWRALLEVQDGVTPARIRAVLTAAGGDAEF